tara:strand:- start:1503 stop:1892 length:390 start_codon:yes stop_codon:yes gene_type:complete
MTQYVLLDSKKIILNKIQYDPKSDWKPPTGQTIGEIPDNVTIEEGGTWDGKKYTALKAPTLPSEIKKSINVQEAKRRLEESDWVGLADVRAKLSNVSDWDTYRASLRDYIINPKSDKLPKIFKTVTWKE